MHELQQQCKLGLRRCVCTLLAARKYKSNTLAARSIIVKVISINKYGSFVCASSGRRRRLTGANVCARRRIIKFIGRKVNYECIFFREDLYSGRSAGLAWREAGNSFGNYVQIYSLEIMNFCIIN